VPRGTFFHTGMSSLEEIWGKGRLKYRVYTMPTVHAPPVRPDALVLIYRTVPYYSALDNSQSIWMPWPQEAPNFTPKYASLRT